MSSASFVCMPWHMLGSPSIQLGILQALLDRAGLACRSHSFHLEFMRFLEEHEQAEHALSLDDYGRVCSEGLNLGLGDWLFAGGLRRASRERDERFREHCRAAGIDRGLLDRLERARDLVPRFLERCADEVLASDPAFVGFTLVYSQTMPSLALAQVLKRRAPQVRILLGGTSCEGPMGPALLRSFEHVDLVLRGEAEVALEPLARSLLEGAAPAPLAGLCWRDAGSVRTRDASEGAKVHLDETPTPVFDEYFERLRSGPFAPRILPQLPLETARGCWWGEKQHCTFCGLNGLAMRFRSKSPRRALEEIEQLAARYGTLDFTSVDNILDLDYFEGVLEPLARRGADFSFFFETKSNLRQEQVALLRAAGVVSIQPGIESLSTPILSLMKKGVTAFQNVRLLKWCAQYGIRPIWNLLYGFPGEPQEEYERMARCVPSLVHLAAPSMGPLMLYRFSPYHERPGEHGLQLGDPLPYYRMLYDAAPSELADLAQVFEFSHRDGREPESYVAALRAEVERWARDADRNAGALSYRRGPGFVAITDTRTTTSPSRYLLAEEEAAIFMACDAGSTVPGILRALEQKGTTRVTESRVREVLGELGEARLVYEDSGKVLALPIPPPASSQRAASPRELTGAVAFMARPSQARAG